MKTAFEQQPSGIPENIHILLAGNSSRSKIVLGYLNCLDQESSSEMSESFQKDLADIFSELPNCEIYLPLDADQSNPYAPTAKTGVALGLLRLCPGESLKVINHAMLDKSDSPFQYYLGSFRRDALQVALHRGHEYEQWVELGKPLNGVMVMGYTSSPTAAVNNAVKRGASGLTEQNLRFSGSIQGHSVFAKVISPNQIEICTASNIDDVQTAKSSNNRVIELR